MLGVCALCTVPVDHPDASTVVLLNNASLPEALTPRSRSRLTAAGTEEIVNFQAQDPPGSPGLVVGIPERELHKGVLNVGRSHSLVIVNRL